jgi:DNA-binding NarL/FixJ family response regulator
MAESDSRQMGSRQMGSGSDQSADAAPPGQGALIVEDRPDTRDWLVAVVGDAFPDLQIATVSSLREARAWLAAHAEAPAWTLKLAVLDLGLPDGSGLELVVEVARDFPDAAPIVATIYDDDTHLFDSLAAGAQGYVLKQEHPDTVADCLRRIEAGEPPLSPSIARRLLERMRPQPAPRPKDDAGLTPREVEVLTLIARGYSAPEAAREIGLKPQTVAGYVKVIYQKLHVSSRAEAVLAAAQRGLT